MESRGVDLFGGPPSEKAFDAKPSTVHRVPAWLFVGAVVGIGVVLGYLGFVLPAPGGSLIGPSAVVAAIGVGVAGGGAVLLAVLGARWQSRLFALLVVLLAGIASTWTFQFSLPAQMAWDVSASWQVQQALRQLQIGPKGAYGVPLHPCRVDQAGSIGPLSAPYHECATSTYVGEFGNKRVNFVFYSTVGTNKQGLAYSNVGTAIFEDECYRHLVGDWWAFNRGNLSNPGDPCSFGYTFSGSG